MTFNFYLGNSNISSGDTEKYFCDDNFLRTILKLNLLKLMTTLRGTNLDLIDRGEQNLLFVIYNSITRLDITHMKQIFRVEDRLNQNCIVSVVTLSVERWQ